MADNITVTDEPVRKCACRSVDPYDCWAVRYNETHKSPREIEADGGPCECSCHDAREEDYDPAEYL